MAVMINDVSSDLEDPPTFLVSPPDRLEYNLERLKKPVSDRYPTLKNQELPVSTAEGFALVRILVHDRGWQVVAEDEAAHRIQAVATTPILRFRDDVIIEVRPRSGGCTIAMRSKSRVGKSDLGANARRIRKFFEEL